MSRRKAPGRADGTAAHAATPVSAAAIVLGAGMFAVPLAMDPENFDAFALPRLAALVVFAAALLPFLWRTASLPHGRLVRITIALGALAAACAIAAAQDPYGAILGNHGYRHGLASLLALAVIATAAATIARDDRSVDAMLFLAAAGALVSCAYALLQWTGADPFDWTAPEGAIFSTAGNQNDLATYSVVCIGIAGPFLLARSRSRKVFGSAVFAACLVQVLLSESRAGIVAAFVAVAVWLVLAVRYSAHPPRVRAMAIVAAALAIGLAVAVTSGAGGSPVSFVEGVSGQGDAGSSLSSRLDIWDGSLSVFAAHPLFGVGPGGLFTEFPRHLGPGGGFPFDRPTGTGNDPLVTSPHNLFLEVAVCAGLVGLAALTLFGAWLVTAAFATLRSGWDYAPALAGGLAGFAVMILLNPLPLGAMTVAAVFVGLIGGRTAGSPVAVQPRSAGRIALAAGAGGIAIASLVAVGLSLMAGHEAATAVEASTRLRDSDALRHSRRAAELAPFESSYRRLESAAHWNLFVTTGQRPVLEDGLGQIEAFLDDFPALASDHLRHARMLQALGDARVDAALKAARLASPHGNETTAELESFPYGASAD